MTLNRIVLSSLATILATKVVVAQQSYATQSQDIRAGIVILDSAKLNVTDPPSSCAPHALYNLSRNTTVRPAGWNIYNPHAASIVTAAIQARWSVLDSTASLPLGMRLTKRHAAYWEVPLTTTSSTYLQDYDFLLVNPNALLSLNTVERQKLARFVDHGGVLWVDPGALNVSNGIDLSNNLPIPFMLKSQSSANEQVDYGQPIVTRPAALTRRDISYLNGYITASPAFTTSLTNVDLSTQGAGGLEAIFGNTATDFFRMQPFFLVGGEPTATVARIGDGFVVTTARGASMKLNRTADSGASYGFNVRFTASESPLEADGLAAAKLAVNMLNLASESRQAGSGAGKRNNSFVDATAPLLLRSVLPASFSSAANAQSVVYKGISIIVDGNRLIASDVDPQQDLDGDGDPDDGIRDLSLGGGVDKLWTSVALSGPLSSPTCVEIPNPSGRPRDAVLVVDSTGTVIVFDITDLTGDLTNKAPLTTITGPGTGTYTMTGTAPNPVTVSEGYGYIVDSTTTSGNVQGRVWMIDLTRAVPDNIKSGSVPWGAGGAGTGVSLPDFSAASTIGYINIADNSGGIDKVLYAPYRPTGASGPSNPPGFVSLWLGSRGEKPISTTAGGGVLDVETRASQRGLPVYTRAAADTLGVRITLIDTNGNPMNAGQTAAIFSGSVSQSSGHIQFSFKTGVTDLPVTVTGVRVDYNIDYGADPVALPGALSQIERGRIAFPNGTSDQLVLGTVALSQRGTLFVCVGNGARGGGLWAFKEEGRGGFRCVNRYQLFENHQIALQGGTLTESGSMFEDNDGIMAFIPTFGTKAMNNLSLVSSPAVSNDQVHVLVKASRGFITNTIVLTFAAEPAAASFRVGDLPDGASFLQMDIPRSSNTDTTSLILPDTQSILSSGSYTYDRASGTIRFDNLMGQTTSGQIVNCLSLSQPLIVRKPGSSQDTLVYPDSLGNATWSPVSWYMVQHGFTPSGAPYVTGNTLFLGGSSVIARFLNGLGFAGTDGMLYAINAKMSSSDTFLVQNVSHPWLNQAVGLKVSGASISGNPNVLWPQNNGIDSLQTFIVRLNQTVLKGSTKCWGISAGDGAIIATGDAGVYSFSRADIVVCDEGRVARLDANGNPVWIAGATLYLGQDDNSSVGIVARLVRPTKAVRIGSADTLVVDTGANRLVRLNYSGIEVRSIDSMQLDPLRAPAAGYKPNEPATFSSPRDVATYVTYETRASALNVFSPTNENPANEYWIHYVVADTGNKRIVELVDRFGYNPTTGQIGVPLTTTYTDPSSGLATTVTQQAMLYWHSPSNVSGKNYDYVAVNRVWIPNVPLTTPATGRFVYVTAIGSSLPTSADLGTSSLDGTALTQRSSSTGNGGVVIFDPAAPAPTVINAVNVPAIGANVFFNESTALFDSSAIPARAQSGAADNRLVMSGVQSVTARTYVDPSYASRPSIAIMVADASGVYEFPYTISDTGATYTPSVTWMLPNSAYVVMRHNGTTISGTNPVQLRAVYAKRLDSGDVILVNGATAPRRRFASATTAEANQFTGEIIQVDGRWDSSRWLSQNLGFDSKSIIFEIPPVQGARGLVHPVFANRN